jgi:hypothetical protein
MEEGPVSLSTSTFRHQRIRETAVDKLTEFFPYESTQTLILGTQ